ncbi:MAG: DUF6713 family protein [Trueperaceae bacterium]
METHFFFVIALSFILMHEMDAVKQHEWRIFPLTFWLNDTTGYLAFTVLHLPLYILLFWNLYTPNGLNVALIRGLDIFFIIHLLLHLLYLRHPKNEFNGWFSWMMIIGAGVAGFIDLIVGF